MTLDRKAVLLRLCQISTRIGHEVFHYDKPVDCFCDQSAPRDPRVVGLMDAIGLEASTFKFDEDIIVFIEQAVVSAIRKAKKANEVATR